MDLGVETGAADGPRRPARRPGFMGEIADGIAGAVLSAPGLAAAVLLASTLWTWDAPLNIGAAFVGGLALSRMRSDRAFLLASVWVGLAAIRWIVQYEAQLRSLRFADLRATGIVLSVIAAAWGARSRRVWILAAVVAAAAGLFLVWPIEREAGTLDANLSAADRARGMLWPIGYFGAMFLLVAAGRRASRIAVIALVVAVTVAPYALSGDLLEVLRAAEFVAWLAVSTACGIVALFVPAVCGMTARAAARGAVPDDGARLVTVLARRPWAAAIFLGIVLYSEVNGHSAFVSGESDPTSTFASLGRIATASVLLAMSASGAAGSLGALAPVCVASVFASCAWLVGSEFSGQDYRPDAVVHRAVLCAAYLVPQILTRGTLARLLGIGRFAMPLLAVTFLLPLIALSERIETSPWMSFAWVVLVTVTTIAVARSDRPSIQIVVVAVVLGSVQRIAMEVLADRVRVSLGAATWLELPTAWMFAAVCAVAARRARTMTAVPVDHPMFVDFARPT